MTIRERVWKLYECEWPNNFADDNIPASVEKMIIMAYCMGREEATRKVSDRYQSLIKKQRERANACRYPHMANKIIGDEDYLYFSDYSSSMSFTFGGDKADI